VRSGKATEESDSGVLSATSDDGVELAVARAVDGSRQHRRAVADVQSTIEDPLARRVLSGEVLEGDTVTFDGDATGDGLKVVTEQPVPA
jgi:ATP-dependent Clp protease ATP-binding subunit ClpB